VRLKKKLNSVINNATILFTMLDSTNAAERDSSFGRMIFGAQQMAKLAAVIFVVSLESLIKESNPNNEDKVK